MNKMVSIIVAIVAIGAWAAFKFFGPTLFVEAETLVGKGWDDAKPELTEQFKASFNQELAEFNLPATTINALTNCCVAKSIEFLNTTDCKYKYNEGTTTEAEHLANQEACLVKVGYEQQSEAFDFECTKLHFPDDWKHLKGMLHQGYAAGLAEAGLAEADAKNAATCMADKTVALFNQRNCPLVNRQAAKAEDLFFGDEDCVKDPDGDKEYLAIFDECGPKAEES